MRTPECKRTYIIAVLVYRMIKKMFKKRYINDTTQQSLSARVDKCRRTLRNKM